MKLAHVCLLLSRGLMILCGVAALVLLPVILSGSPARVSAASDCIGWGCGGPVRDAYIICCNQLVYEPGKEGTGADRTVRCSDYLRNRASAETRRSICNRLRAEGKLCPAASSACNSPNGRHCGGSVPESGTIYSSGGGLHSEPSSNSPAVGKTTSGSRLRYTKTTRVGGQTWYYIDQPGSANDGWAPGSGVSCTRPSPSDYQWTAGLPDIDWSVVRASEPDTAMAIRGGMEGGGSVYHVPVISIDYHHEAHPYP